MVNVLVAYGTTRGGTQGLAEMIGAELHRLGHHTDVRPAAEPTFFADVDAVVVAGALYAGRWHKDARQFVKRYAGQLERVPVWLVSTGPLDDSAVGDAIAPVHHVRAAAAKIGARGAQTFGGHLCAGTTGFPARAMAKNHAGDWRDAEHVARWARTVDAELRA